MAPNKFTTTADHFRAYPMPYYSDAEMPGYDRAGRNAVALVVCGSCGCVEEVRPDARTLHDCSSECHAPRCPCCNRVEYEKADPKLARCMVKVEPFRTDRLLPRSNDPSMVYTPGGWTYGVNVAMKIDGFVLTRPYHAHTRLTAPPGDFRIPRGSHDTLGHEFER